MLPNHIKNSFLNVVFDTYFAQSVKNCTREIVTFINKVHVIENPGSGIYGSILLEGRKIKHPYVEFSKDPKIKYSNYPSTKVKDPALIEEGLALFQAYDVIERRRKAVMALVKRILWQCNGIKDLEFLLPPKLYQAADGQLLVIETLSRFSNFDTEVAPYYGKITISKEAKQAFYEQETKALATLDRHILITDLTR